MAHRQTPETETQPYRRLGWPWRLLISLLVMFHIAAVFIPPFSFQTLTRDGRSPIAERLMSTFRWYIDVAYLDHGYAFFAPNPGPSHLIQYELEFDDGRPPLQQTFPDLSRHRPRLLYHRHFMLSEHLNNSYAPLQPPAELSPADRPTRRDGQTEEQYQAFLRQWKRDLERWEGARRHYEERWAAFENHLLKKYGASKITMKRVRHLLPPPIRTMGPTDLGDERSYQYAGRDEEFARTDADQRFPPTDLAEPIRP